MDLDAKKYRETQEMSKEHCYDHLDFMARMYSHNLKAPVAGLKMLLEIAETDPASVDVDLITNIIEGSRELFNTIDDISINLQDYRLLQHEKSNIVLEDLTREVAAQVVQDEQLMLTTKYENCAELYYYPSVLRVLYRELIKNALAFKKPDQPASLHISVDCDESWVEFSFKDQGIGIDIEKHSSHLFKMYKPLQGNKVQQGKCTGLFRVKNLVEITGGKVGMESEVGVGTDVIIQIPYC